MKLLGIKGRDKKYRLVRQVLIPFMYNKFEDKEENEVN